MRMDRDRLRGGALWFFVAVVLSAVALWSVAAGAQVKNPDSIVYAMYGEPETLDPAFAYDTASGEAIYNIYDNLIAYDKGSTSDFVPMLATKVPSLKNGLISKDGRTYIFPIRRGVKFQNGATLTPLDVEYTFERAMLLDPAAGPTWMISEPLLGYATLTELAAHLMGVSPDKVDMKKLPAKVVREIYDRVTRAVEVKGDNVIFHLAKPYPPFLAILAHGASWSAIINKKWAIAQGAWDGLPSTWPKYHDPQPQADPLYAKAMGTGPFKLETWQRGSQYILTRFDGYWQGPAKIKTVYAKKVDEFSTRLMMLQTGDADIIMVDPPYLPQVEKLDGVRVTKSLPRLQNTTAFFNYNIDPKGNDYIGSGKLDGNGIPSDFFQDIHVRKAFNYLFDWDSYIKQVLLGQGAKPYGPVPQAMAYYVNKKAPTYSFNLEKAAEEFKQAFDGKLWQTGFKMTITYNTGNEARKTACEMLAANAAKVNPKFRIETMAVQWPVFLQKYKAGVLPLFIIGWLADYPDPYNFVQPYMASTGAYGSTQGDYFVQMARKDFDPLIDETINNVDPAVRRAAFFKLQELAYERAIDIFLVEPYGNHVERTWVKGWYFNPVRPGEDFYILSKGE